MGKRYLFSKDIWHFLGPAEPHIQSVSSGGSLLWIKPLGPGPGRSRSSSPEVENEWRCTSIARFASTMCTRRILPLPFQCCIKIAVSSAKIIYCRVRYLFVNIWHDSGASRLRTLNNTDANNIKCLELSLNAWSHCSRDRREFTPEYIATAATGPLSFTSRTLLPYSH